MRGQKTKAELRTIFEALDTLPPEVRTAITHAATMIDIPDVARIYREAADRIGETSATAYILRSIVAHDIAFMGERAIRGVQNGPSASPRRASRPALPNRIPPKLRQIWGSVSV